MRRNSERNLLFIDLIGTAVVGALLSGAVWLAIGSGRESSAEIAELTRLVRGARLDARSLRQATSRQRTVLRSRQEALSRQGGLLPTTAPVEHYFKQLSALASDHRLEVLRHQPMTPRRYPGLLEQRFAYGVRGATPDLVRFLNAVEHTDFWADISYFKLDTRSDTNQQAPDRRVMDLTFSMFSSVPVDATPEDEDA